MNTKHSKYCLLNPEKYMENLPAPVCKSSWEERVFEAMDGNAFITKWGYEPFDIYYMSPKYQKMSIYKPDIYCECKSQESDKPARWLIEIKPHKFSVMPESPPTIVESATPSQVKRHSKKMARYYAQCEEVMVNQAKWSAARNWCSDRGVNWLVLTEKNAPGSFI